MNHKVISTMLGFCLLSLAGCGDDKADALVGSWKLDAGLGSVTMTFSDDATWVLSAVGLVGGSESGTWEIEDNNLVVTTEKSTRKDATIGKAESSKIVTLNDTVLVLQMTDDRGQEQVMTWQRLR